jgi:hypothetical protein
MQVLLVMSQSKKLWTQKKGSYLPTPVSVINVTHIICEQCFYTSLSVINVNNLNNALTLIQA